MSGMNYTVMQPSTMLNPTPAVLVSCADPQRPENRNMITLAWAGTVNSEPPMVSVSIRKERYSHGYGQGKRNRDALYAGGRAGNGSRGAGRACEPVLQSHKDAGAWKP